MSQTSSHHGGSRTKDGKRAHFTLESQCQRHIDHLQPIDPSTPSTLSIPTISHACGSIIDAPTSLCVSQDKSQSPHEHGQWISGGSGKSSRWGHTVVSLSPGSHEHLILDPSFPAGLVSLRQDATSPFIPLQWTINGRDATDADDPPPRMPGSPLTYFPNPSTFTLPPGQHPYTSITSDSPRTYHSPIPGRPPSMAPTISSTDDEDGKGDRTPRTSRYPQSAAQAHLSGAWGAGDSSPRDRRSTATSIDLRRVSTANPLSANAASTSTSTSIRTTSTPGYGSTHHTPIGLGLGNPEHSQRVARRNGDALSSPRRISTSIPSANASQIQLQSSQAQARSPLPNPPITHEGYYSYSNSQPNSGTTPRFKDSRQGYTIPNNHLATPGASSGMHRRNFSIGSILSPSNPTPSSPSGSVMRRIRKTASTVGLSVGRPQNYDGDDHVNRPQDAGDIDDDEIVNDSMKANGTRVWYRWVDQCLQIEEFAG